MKPTLELILKDIKLVKKTKSAYRKLQEHLDTQPVGYPSTRSGVELRLLQEFFTTQEAEVALILDWKFQDFDTLSARARSQGRSEPELRDLLQSMEKKGCIFVKREGDGWVYALHPLVIGMFEMRLTTMTPGFYLDVRKYMGQKFAMEYLTTDVPQMRVIPIDKAIDTRQRVSTYDEIRTLIQQNPGSISISECICRKGKEMLGEHCQVTDRLETCMGFRDFADTWIRHGWGRGISKQEALEILAQNEKDGLMLLSATMQEPQFVCSCCGCCCGITGMIAMLPRPADFAASNYVAWVDSTLCNGCQKCVKRCHLSAIEFNAETRRNQQINPARCIGCGLCVVTCKKGAIQLHKKSEEFVPPKDHEALFAQLEQNKPGSIGKTLKMAKAILGRKT